MEPMNERRGPVRLVPETLVDAARRQAHAAGYLEAMGDYRDPNDDPQEGTIMRQGYRPLAESGAVRGYGDINQSKILALVWDAWLRDAMAARMIELKKDHIIGAGVRPECEYDDLRDLLFEFWDDNSLDERAPKFVTQLYLFGDQCFSCHTRKSDGRVRLGYIDPDQIERVISHPQNGLEKYAVVVKEQSVDSVDSWAYHGEGKRVYRIARKGDAVLYDDGDDPEVKQAPPEFEGKLLTAEQAASADLIEPWELDMLAKFERDEYDGTVLLTQVGNLANMERGVPDLVRFVDPLWSIELVDAALVGREELAALFSYDVLMKGASDDECKARSAEIALNPPARGRAFVHNENEEWDLKTPDLKQSGSVQTSEHFITKVIGEAGFPRTWFGRGEGANRATAREMQRPTWKSLESDQTDVENMLLAMCAFVRDQAVIAGKLTLPEKNEDYVVTFPMPEMATLDMQGLSAAASQLADALGKAVKAGWLTDLRAASLWARLMAELGEQYDADQEFDEAQKEKEKRAEKAQAIFDQQKQGDDDENKSPFDQNGDQVDQDNPQDGPPGQDAPDEQEAILALSRDPRYKDLIRVRPTSRETWLDRAWDGWTELDWRRRYEASWDLTGDGGGYSSHEGTPFMTYCPVCQETTQNLLYSDHGGAAVCQVCGCTHIPGLESEQDADKLVARAAEGEDDACLTV